MNKTTAAYPITTAQVEARINEYYERTHNVKNAWAKGARGWAKGARRRVKARTFVESPRTAGAWKEIFFGQYK